MSEHQNISPKSDPARRNALALMRAQRTSGVTASGAAKNRDRKTLMPNSVGVVTDARNLPPTEEYVAVEPSTVRGWTTKTSPTNTLGMVGLVEAERAIRNIISGNDYPLVTVWERKPSTRMGDGRFYVIPLTVRTERGSEEERHNPLTYAVRYKRDIEGEEDIDAAVLEALDARDSFALWLASMIEAGRAGDSLTTFVTNPHPLVEEPGEDDDATEERFAAYRAAIALIADTLGEEEDAPDA